MLAIFGQPPVPTAVFCVNGRFPAVVAVDQISGKGAGVVHRRIFRSVTSGYVAFSGNSSSFSEWHQPSDKDVTLDRLT